MGSLKTYRAKRDFRITSEPEGSGDERLPKRKKATRFVIHKHDATRLHYDLRLEHDGVLWSWAVTRGPSLDPSEKRLAVHVEDHPLAYGSFEGVIPAGQYGAGAVIVWDEGEWLPEFDPDLGMKKGHLRFALKGNKLNGEWHLVRLKPRGREKADNWLLIKSDDDHARATGDILEEAPASVSSGRTIEDIYEGRKAKKKPAAKAAKKSPAKKSGGKDHPALKFVEPCLAELQKTPPLGDDWVHEVKFDGYRLQAHVTGGKTKLLTRTGLDWTHKFGEAIPAALNAMDIDDAIVDGEVVVLDARSASNFSDLQLALSEGRSNEFIYYVFDLLRRDGEDLTGESLIERKDRLRAIVGDDAEGAVRYSEHFVESGATMLEHACRMGLEGVISKRASAPYRSGRTGDWIKAKCTLRQEFVIAGYLPSEKTGRGLRSLVVAYRDEGELRSAGHVGTGFSVPVANDLLAKLKKRVAKVSPFDGPAARERNVVWVKPDLVAEIEFRSWTRGGSIRHASFQGLREDKPAAEVVMEKPVAKKAPSKRDSGRTKTVAKHAEGVTLSSPDKRLWPDDGVTKKDLLNYYESVWPRMQQFVVDRPLALVRAPDGINGQRFFQKHASPGTHAAIRRMADPEDGEELLYIDSFDGVAALVQLGVVEIHIWGSKIGDIERPDQIVFDLDPDEGLDFAAVQAASLEVRDKLDELKLPHRVKVTGGKGLHIVVPLKPKADWAAVKGFAHDFAHAMAQEAPERYTATLSKKARTGRIFIDYLRNGRGSTAVAPYSSRARAGATLALPVSWGMVEKGVKPADFKIGGKALAARLKAADPWADFFAIAKTLDLS